VNDTIARVATALTGIPHRFVIAIDGMVCVVVERAQLRDTMVVLKQKAGFETNTFVTAVDHYPATPRFEMSYQFLSCAHNDRVRVQTHLDENDAKVPTITDLWPGTSFSERECYDMFGIHFEGHPDLRRLLMPAGYEHHPLRKDFPHQGIEPDRLYRTWDGERRKDWNPAT
jgi:NADH-quinone oxidoreductase subunit C